VVSAGSRSSRIIVVVVYAYVAGDVRSCSNSIVAVVVVS
jgi:hypothetical protein